MGIDKENENLEYQFSPSRWSKRFDPEGVLKHHMEYITKASNNVRREIQCELNIPYGKNPGEKYDIYGTNLPKDSPILIHVHGGYWQELNKNISSYVVPPFYQNRMKVIILGYDLCPSKKLEEVVEEIKNGFGFCLRYAAKNFSKGVYLSGHSAGAHLVSSLFNNYPGDTENFKDLLKAVFLISGVFDLRLLIHTYVNAPLHLDEKQAEKLSPLLQTMSWGKTVKFYVVVGEHESDAFKQQSGLYHQKLRELKLNSRFVIIKDVDHFDIVENISKNQFELTTLMLNEINRCKQINHA